MEKATDVFLFINKETENNAVAPRPAASLWFRVPKKPASPDEFVMFSLCLSLSLSRSHASESEASSLAILTTNGPGFVDHIMAFLNSTMTSFLSSSSIKVPCAPAPCPRPFSMHCVVCSSGMPDTLHRCCQWTTIVSFNARVLTSRHHFRGDVEDILLLVWIQAQAC